MKFFMFYNNVESLKLPCLHTVTHQSRSFADVFCCLRGSRSYFDSGGKCCSSDHLILSFFKRSAIISLSKAGILTDVGDKCSSTRKSKTQDTVIVNYLLHWLLSA